MTNRRNFLLGGLAGVSVAGVAQLASRVISPPAECPPDAPPAAPPEKKTAEQLFGKSSFAQQGEDLVIEGILGHLNIQKISYIDIGAGHPIAGNNTYKLFQKGHRGVVVEPNPKLAAQLREVRQGDTVLEAGIGVSNEAEADYYTFKKYGQLNTFSKEQADVLIARFGPDTLDKVIKRQLLNINDVFKEQFKGAPTFMSLDIEGLDEDVLRTLDFEKYRPVLLCVETSEINTGALREEIITFMASKNYAVRGGSFVNSIFMDRRMIAPSRAEQEKLKKKP
jgi:FkbM family methyltransferase